MRKLLLTASICCVVCATFAGVTAGVAYDVPRITGGKMEANSSMWQKQFMQASLLNGKTRVAAHDFSATVYLGWTTSGLRIGLAMYDNERTPDSNVAITDGTIQIYIIDAWGGKNLAQFNISPYTKIINTYDYRRSSSLYNIPLSIPLFTKITPDSIYVETEIPFNILDITPAAGSVFGFQVCVYDFDSDNREGKKIQWHFGKDSQRNPFAIYPLRLTAAAPYRLPYSINAFVTDNKEVTVEVQGDGNLVGAPIKIMQKDIELISGTMIKGENGESFFTTTLNDQNIITVNSSLQVLVNNALPMNLYPWVLPVKYIITQSPNPYEEDFRMFELQEKLYPSAQNATMFIGSSTIRKWYTLEKDMFGSPVINRGFGGSCMEDVLYCSRRVVLPCKPSAIVLYEGDNDLTTKSVPVTKFIAQCRQFIQMVHDSLPATEIYLLSIKPSPSRARYSSLFWQANQLLDSIAAKDSLVHYINIAQHMTGSDGETIQDLFLRDNLHLSRKGYMLWGDVIREAVLPENKKK